MIGKTLTLVCAAVFVAALVASGAEPAKAAPAPAKAPGKAAPAPAPAPAKAKAEPAENWEDRVEKALDGTVGDLSWKEEALPDVLAAIGKAAGVAVILDPKAAADPKKIKITLTVSRENRMTLRSVLANVLKLSSMRYTLRDEAVFVSTRERLVAELLAGDEGPTPAVPGLTVPMTPADAMVATTDFYDDSEEHLPETITDFVRGPVDARFEKPAYRDAQGRLNFPAPPMIIADPDILNPLYRFDTRPWFLKPAYLAPYYWGPESRAASADPAKVRETESLKALLEYMKNNPELTVGQLIQQLEAGAAKGKAAQ
jgi:hypothetical protein